MAGLSIFHSFAKSEMFALSRLALAGLFCISLNAAAFAKSDHWARCRGADPDARIAGCTEIIARGSKETKRNQITAYINRGSAYRATDDFDRAIADLDKAVQLDPKSSLALTKRASIYHEKGDLDRAIADYDAAIAAQPKSAAAFYGRAKPIERGRISTAPSRITTGRCSSTRILPRLMAAARGPTWTRGNSTSPCLISTKL